MLATSRSGERLNRLSAHRGARLALEVDDHEIAAGVEHLPEVEVPVHPRPEPRERLPEQALGSGRGSRASEASTVGGERPSSSGSRRDVRASGRRLRRVRFRIDWYIERW